MNSDIKELADWAQSQEWTVLDDSKGYTRFYNPEATTSCATRPHPATRDAACWT